MFIRINDIRLVMFVTTFSYFIFCGFGGGGGDNKYTETLLINSQLVDCVGVSPQKCMQVKRNELDEWELFYDEIKGFIFVEGYVYEILVEVVDVENPPADASSKEYFLTEMISKKHAKVIVYEFDLHHSYYDWQAGFADYPEGEENEYELESEWKKLPAPLNYLNGINVVGNNHSDDLFMYIKRKLEGLKPNTLYLLVFRLQIATNASMGCVGIGGAPGESVFVKAGATSHEPNVTRDSQGFMRMNIDKGNQSMGGRDAVVIGDLANTQTDCMNTLYELKDFNSSCPPFEVLSGQDGTIWGLFGTDSGFEATTNIYYTHIEIRAEEK